MSRYTAVSLFSGAGGMDIGIKQAGFDILACIEKDCYACETLRYNIEREGAHTQVFENDIREIDPAELMHQINIESGEIDLLFGGPPCQSFSQIGKRLGILDERGLLLFQMVRFAHALMPRSIIIEQVKGVLKSPDKDGNVGGTFKHFITELKSLGYEITWKVLNAADYGVPQKRERVFIVGMRDSLHFNFPTPSHTIQSDHLSFFDMPLYRTVGDVIGQLPPPIPKNGHIPADSHVDVTPAGDRRRIKGVPEGQCLAHQLHLPAEQRQRLTKKDTTKFRRLAHEDVSLTLRCGEIFYHPTEDRYLTPREYMRIHGYPDTYELRGPVRGRSGQVKNLDQHRQVANSVPPPLANILAQAVRKTLDGTDI